VGDREEREREREITEEFSAVVAASLYNLPSKLLTPVQKALQLLINYSFKRKIEACDYYNQAVMVLFISLERHCPVAFIFREVSLLSWYRASPQPQPGGSSVGIKQSLCG
jgi:hypothetical protein